MEEKRRLLAGSEALREALIEHLNNQSDASASWIPSDLSKGLNHPYFRRHTT